MILTNIFIFIVFLFWGSFLNVVAHRLIAGTSLWGPRSQCPKCAHIITWYDNIPVLSFLLLKGKCRSCTQLISFLYPFIELLTAVLCTILFNTYAYPYLISYGIFFSALIVTIRTDLEHMLISRWMSLFLMPIAIIFSFIQWLPITPFESIASATIAYLFLLFISKTYTFFSGKLGIGQGDLDLLACIGAFTGLYGIWISLLIGSLTGSIIGVGYLLITGKKQSTMIPFGPFLATGAIGYVLYGKYILNFLFI